MWTPALGRFWSKKMNLKNSIKSKITSLFFCIIWIIIGTPFAYVTITKFSYNITFYFVIIAFFYLEFINVKDFISVNKIYTLENNNLMYGENTITPDEIDAVEFVIDKDKNTIQYIINAKKKIIIDNSKDFNLQNYINYVFDYKEKQFDLSEKNFLFEKKNIMYLFFFVCLFASIILQIFIKNPFNEINYFVYFFLFIIGFGIIKEIINIIRVKNGYFTKEDIFINNKHILYKEITKIERTEKLLISIETEKFKLKIPSRYIKYDKIIEDYIQKKYSKIT